MKYKLQQKRGELMEKYSRQRDIIFNILKSLTSHPTAEEIYVLAKEQEPNISRGTVYRNLAFLVEKDMIIKISMENGPERYDYIRKEHSHVICANCGKVWDFYYDFKLDSLGIFQYAKLSETQKDEKLQKELTCFANQWMRNIKLQQFS